MPFELQKLEAGVRLILSGKLGVQQARPLWDAVQPSIGANQTIWLQAGELEDMDTSVIQILCRISSQTGGLKIGETSDGFLAALERRGLEQFFVQPPERSEESQTTQPELETQAKSARQGHG